MELVVFRLAQRICHELFLLLTTSIYFDKATNGEYKRIVTQVFVLPTSGNQCALIPYFELLLSH